MHSNTILGAVDGLLNVPSGAVTINTYYNVAPFAAQIEATKEQQRQFRQQQAELAKALRQIKQQQGLLHAQSSAMRSLEG